MAYSDTMSAKWNMAVGDLSSDEKGSGARDNGYKQPLDLIPVSVWRNNWRHDILNHPQGIEITEMLYGLQRWQEGETAMLDQMMVGVELGGAVDVFSYGAKKYAEWNWAKGMQWSVPLGCALRHVLAMLEGEALDPESGQPHLNHVYCNVIMLQYFARHYPDGDDRPIFKAEQ